MLIRLIQLPAISCGPQWCSAACPGGFLKQPDKHEIVRRFSRRSASVPPFWVARGERPHGPAASAVSLSALMTLGQMADVAPLKTGTGSAGNHKTLLPEAFRNEKTGSLRKCKPTPAQERRESPTNLLCIAWSRVRLGSKLRLPNMA